MKLKRTASAILSILMVSLIFLTGCGKNNELKPVDSIKIVDRETVMQITPEMTRKQLYQLLGETYGQQTNGQNGFLATYIIDGKYIYSVSVFNDASSDTALGYDGEALIKSLENSRELTTQREMTVNSKKDLNEKDINDGFSVSVDYDGKYTAYMNGYPVSVKNKEITQKTKLSGKNTLSVDVSSALKKEVEKKESKDGTTDDTTAVQQLAENRLLGLLEIRNDAEEVVYVEIYIAGNSFISRVRQ